MFEKSFGRIEGLRANAIEGNVSLLYCATKSFQVYVKNRMLLNFLIVLVV